MFIKQQQPQNEDPTVVKRRRRGVTISGLVIALLIIGGGVAIREHNQYVNQEQAVDQLEQPYSSFKATAAALNKKVADNEEFLSQPVFSSAAWKEHVADDAATASKPSRQFIAGINDVEGQVKYADLKKRLNALKVHYQRDLTGETVLKTRAIGVGVNACNKGLDAVSGSELNRAIGQAALDTQCSVTKGADANAKA